MKNCSRYKEALDSFTCEHTFSSFLSSCSSHDNLSTFKKCEKGENILTAGRGEKHGEISTDSAHTGERKKNTFSFRLKKIIRDFNQTRHMSIQFHTGDLCCKKTKTMCLRMQNKFRASGGQSCVIELSKSCRPSYMETRPLFYCLDHDEFGAIR